MANLGIGDVVRFKVYTRLSQTTGINRHYLRVDATGALPFTTAQFLELWAANMHPLYRGCMAAEANLVGSQIAILTGAPPGVWTDLETTTTQSGGGTGASGPQPPQIAGLLAHQTAVAGRSGKGRSYIPFPATADIGTDTNPTLAYRAFVRAIGMELIGGGPWEDLPTSVNFKWMHQYNAGITPVLSFVDRPLWGTVRRRGAWAGPDQVPLL